jgi:hypothetical protein
MEKLKKLWTWIKRLYRVAPREGARKLWCFYWDPYRIGLSTTLLLAIAFVLVILLILIVGTIGAAGVGLFGGVLFLLYYAALIAFGLVGFLAIQADERGWVVGLITCGISIGIFSSTHGEVHEYVQGLMETAGNVFMTMAQPGIHTYQFVQGNWLAITLVIFWPSMNMALIAGTLVGIVGILHLLEWSVTKWYGIRFPCPVCARPSEPALYICPNCKTEHQPKLVPNAYGLLHHECEQCKHKLPTMLLLGRNKRLPRKCRHAGCGHWLNNAVGTDKHIAFVGGKNTGKTCLLVQTTRILLENPASSIIEKIQAQEYQRLQSQILTGDPPDSTYSQTEYRAFQLELPGKAFPYHVHLYDLSGEVFRSAHEAATYPFYRNLDALVFLIDPLAVEDYREKHDFPSTVGYASDDPKEIFDNMVQAFARHRPTNARMPMFYFFLVKTDLKYMAPSAENDPEAMERFMVQELGLAPLVSKGKNVFGKQVAFVCGTALGRSPDEKVVTAFEYEGLRKPLAQILQSIHIKS